MANLSVTASTILAAVASVIGRGKAGVTITPGQVLYLAADNTLKLADANDDATTAAAVGIAINGGSATQPISYIKSGTMSINSVALAGQTYWTSNTAGGIWDTEPASGAVTSVIGVGVTTTSIKIGIINSGATVA